MTNLAISFDDVVQAAKRIEGAAHRTPVLKSATADAMTGAKLFFKCENFQRMGAFKFRGAYNAISQFAPEQMRGGVVAFSSGNHAQAIALSARLLGTKAVIIMPNDAPKVKIEATKDYGAEVILYDRYTEDREEIGRRLSQERGLTLIPPYDHAHVMAGQGTLALELFEEVGDLDMLVVCLGGGGMLSGCAIVAKHINPKCIVIGVEPEAGNDAQQSFRSGKIVHIESPKTIADGAQTQHLGNLTFPVIQKCVDDIGTVTDDQLVNAMSFFASRMKMIVEPTGCLAAAYAFNTKAKISGKKVGIVLSGGNVDLVRFAALIQAA